MFIILLSSSTIGSRLFIPPSALFKSLHIDCKNEIKDSLLFSSKLLSIAFCMVEKLTYIFFV